MSESSLVIEEIDNKPGIVISQTDAFGGVSCDKLAMLYKGLRYIVKLPDNFKDLAALYPDKKFSDYSMDPACEWLGYRIFKSVEIPVQNVRLCRYKGKIVAVCENFEQPNEILLDFRYLYDTWSRDIMEPVIQQMEGKEAIGLDDIAKIVQYKYPASGIEDFFWEMFIIDALIGNNDRNMSNWGILINNDTSFSRIAPVFDNGSSFSKGWSDAYITEAMKDIPRLKDIVCNLEIPFVYRGNIISHNSYLNGSPDANCSKALMTIVPKINLNKYCKDIDELAATKAISAIKVDFYKQSLDWRYCEILQPALKQAQSRSQGASS